MVEISYKRCVYESVDDKSLPYNVYQKSFKTEFMQHIKG